MSERDVRRDFGVVVPAAGAGARFQAAPAACGLPPARKQFIELLGRPILHYSLDVFARIDAIASVVIVAPADAIAEMRAVVARWRAPPGASSLAPAIDVVPGGSSRFESVRLGVGALASRVENVLVHDAARPLLAVDDARAVVEAIRAHGAAAIGQPAADSLHRGDGVAPAEGASVVELVDRTHVWSVQTPQGASLRLLENAYESLGRSAIARATFTDEVSLVFETLGISARLVPGSRANIKLTVAEDLRLAEAILIGTRAERR